MSVSSATRRGPLGPPRRSNQYSRNHRATDYQTEIDTDHKSSSPRIGQRSQSLSALQQNVVIQPRMAQLETLEAKMASIEVSLSSGAPRRKKCQPLSSASPRNLLNTSNTPLDQLEGLRNALKDKENIIRNLREQVNYNNNNNNNTIMNISIRERYSASNSKELLTEQEIRHLKDRMHRLKQDTDNKKLTIKNLKLALDKLDITDNIDIRIQQAELEYQLGREELNLLTLLEETRAAQTRLDESSPPAGSNSRSGGPPGGSVHNVVTRLGGRADVLALEIHWSTLSPCFGCNVTPEGIFIEWCNKDSKLKKGDRLVEINDKLLITRMPSLNDLNRLLSACPDPAHVVILRGCFESVPQLLSPNSEVATLRSELGLVRERADEARRAKDGLRADNLRLTHRISYLEEQVSELLKSKRHHHHGHGHSKQHQQQNEQQIHVVTATAVHNNQNVTNINIGSGDVQVFQKGSQVTALVASNTRSGSQSRTPSSPRITSSEKYLTDDDIESRSSRRKADARSVKSLELDSEPYSTASTTTNGYAKPRKCLDYTSEPVSSSIVRKRPTPPKKPIRLSLHRAQSLQNVEPPLAGNSNAGLLVSTEVSSHSGRKRTHKGERSGISGLRWPQGSLQSVIQFQHKHSTRWC